MYAVKEIYYTLQGEGAQTGRPSVFLRFAGCNLWSGREADRASAQCNFCDTDFVNVDGPGGGKFETARSLARAAARLWPGPSGKPFVVCTGGEPLLQLDEPLVNELHAAGFEIAIETNGTIAAPPGIDWITVSPKAEIPLKQTSGDELKLIHPQPSVDPADYLLLPFNHFFLQPLDGPEREANTRQCVAYCLEHPVWRLSLQTHKYLGIA
jgi:7-carboxy-7-deazaguanine synthase (Cx14CxxC type)